MLLSELLYDGEYLRASTPEVFGYDIPCVSSDSRNIKSGAAFVCLRGMHTDGMLYISEAAARGASVCICESPPVLCQTEFVIVKNARLCLSYMLCRFYSNAAEKMKIFAVTGTNGKTSTCSFLREIFLSAGKKTAYIGTLKSYIGRDRFYLGKEDEERMSTMTTPDPEQFYRMLEEMKKQGVEYLIMEASSHALRLDKLAPLHFAASAFTNFSAEHLDFHCDLSNYLLSKCKIFSMSDKVYVNADDSVCRSSVGVFSAPTVTFGVKNESCDYVAKDIESHGIDGISYTLRSKDAAFRISSHIPGAFTVYNTLAAACMSYEEGISPSVIGEAIKNVSCVEGRLEKIKLGQQCGDISVFIDYAHTEKAMENLLLSVIQFKGAGQRIVTLFGCGGDRDKAKRAPMGRVASLYSDFVIITEDNSRSEDPEKIIYDIMKGIDQTKPHIIIKNRKKAIEYAIKTALPGDIILLVGKGHEQYEITKEGKVPFSEKDIVFECLQEKNGGNK